MRISWLCVVYLAGCSSDTSAVPDAASTIAVDARSIRPTKFASVHEVWNVPESGTENGFYSANSATARERWALLDFDGDGRPDLVQTADSESASNASWSNARGSYWKVYKSGPTGFSDIALEKQLPAEAETGILHSLFLFETWEITDLNNDGLLDLVITFDKELGTLWRNEEQLSWRVYLGTQSGFAEAKQWNMPDVGSRAFKSINRCAAQGCWRLLDLTGDGLPDLVHASDVLPLSAFDSPISPNWHVFANTGTGFASEFTRWTLPKSELDSGFFGTDLNHFWSIRDIDSDGELELVQSQPYPNGGLDSVMTQLVWKLYRQSGDGFSPTAEYWNIPRVALERGFYTPDVSSVGEHWTTVDINNDGFMDLVHTANSTSPVPSAWGSPNSDQWKVYLGGIEGFSEAVTSWALPDSGTEDGFFSTRAAQGGRHWVLQDLDGDGQVELVQTTDPETGQVWKTAEDAPYWRVYRTIE